MSNRKPVIGVIPLYDEEKESIWMLPGYLDGLYEAGAIPVIMPLRIGKEELRQLDAQFDGYLLTGGHDVNPRLYNAKKTALCGVVCQERDELERQVFELAWQQDKPVLGICRGIQLLNALQGGTLYQDLEAEYPGKSRMADHHMLPPYDRTVHMVEIEKDSPLYDTVGCTQMGVNSYHHQAVRELGRGLKVMARAEDGLIEGVWAPEKHFIWGIQWHPEFIYQVDENARKIFRAFVEACL